MKTFLTLLVISLSSSAISWSSSGEHPLWEALDIEIVRLNDFIEVKSIGPVLCQRIRLDDFDCELNLNASLVSINLLYNSLKKSYRYQDFYFVDKLIITMNRLVYEHNCYNMQDYSNAKNCIDQFSKQVLGGDTNYNLVAMSAQTRGFIRVLAQIPMTGGCKNWSQLLDYDYIAFVEESFDHNRVSYYGINNAKHGYRLPTLLCQINMSELIVDHLHSPIVDEYGIREDEKIGNKADFQAFYQVFSLGEDASEGSALFNNYIKYWVN